METVKVQARKEAYIAPQVDKIDISVEKGFAASVTPNPGGDIEEV